MKTERSSFISHWSELSDHILPRRGRFSLTDVNRGDRRSSKIIDSSGTFASNTLGAGMHSSMTSPSSPWFEYTTADPALRDIPNVKKWLYDVTNVVLAVFAKTNLYNKLPMLYRDAGVFATGAMLHLEDDEDVSHFETFPIGSYMLGVDAKGRVRLFMREYTMTVQQILDEFAPIGPDGNYDMRNISSQVQELHRSGSLLQKIDVCHAIVPNRHYNPTDGHMVAGPKKAFLECYYEIGTDRTWIDGNELFLREGGYDEFPVYGFRWEVAGEDIYGTNSPGMTALGDIKQLQHGEKRGAQVLDLLTKPPMKGPPSLKSAKASIIPGDITYVDESEKGKFEPAFQVNPDFQSLEFKQEQKRQLIRRAFHEDLFLMMISDNRLQPRTAKEIQERSDEKLQALGPVVEQITKDVLDPLTTRQFNICMRKGMFPPIPEELRGAKLKIEYVSVMARAQKMIGMGSLDRWTASMIQIATVQPDVLDNINVDELAQTYHTMTGVPPKLLRDPKDVAAIRDARAKQAQAAQAAAVAKDVGQAASSLASADTRTPNALTDLLATSRAPGAQQRRQ
jgi:hypothetical protein